MKNWRPANWEETITHVIVEKGTELWNSSWNPIELTLEAGADAMLEARKQVEQGLLKVIDEYVRMMLRDMIKPDDD